MSDYNKLKDLVANMTVNSGNVSVTGTSGGFTGSLSGDVSGSQNSTSVVALQGRAVGDLAPSNGHVLTWNSTTNQWEPKALPAGGGGASSWNDLADVPTSFPPGGAASGDLTGNYPSPTIANGAVTGSKIADATITQFLSCFQVETRVGYQKQIHSRSAAFVASKT